MPANKQLTELKNLQCRVEILKLVIKYGIPLFLTNLKEVLSNYDRGPVSVLAQYIHCCVEDIKDELEDQ